MIFSCDMFGCDHDVFHAGRLGQPDVYAKARKKVEAILDGPEKNPLPDKVAGRLEDILRRADRELEVAE